MLGDGRSIVLQAHKPVGESPRCVYTEETHQPPRLYFPLFSVHTGGYCDHSSSLPAAARPCSSPLSNPVTAEPERRRSCRRTARKRAAATIIALIARFFCWVEISGGATILLLKPPPKKPPSKDGERVRQKKKKKTLGVRSPARLPSHCRMAHTCTLTPPLK